MVSCISLYRVVCYFAFLRWQQCSKWLCFLSLSMVCFYKQISLLTFAKNLFYLSICLLRGFHCWLLYFRILNFYKKEGFIIMIDHLLLIMSLANTKIVSARGFHNSCCHQHLPLNCTKAEIDKCCTIRYNFKLQLIKPLEEGKYVIESFSCPVRLTILTATAFFTLLCHFSMKFIDLFISP